MRQLGGDEAFVRRCDTITSRTAELVGSTADAAYATDDRGTILAWNQAARGLLGYEESQVLGARCWRLLCGTDACGNRLCRPNCWVAQAVRHREPLHRFPVNLRAADGTSVCAQISILVLRPQGPSERRAIVHVLNPCRGREQGMDIEERQSGWRDGLGKTLEAVDPATVLSTRELEILRLLAEGSDTHETAHALFISATTVRNHIQHILAKLGAHSRLAAVSAAKRRGII